MSKKVFGGCLILMACVASLAGCKAQAGLGLAAHERQHRRDLIRERERGALQDDIDMMLLNDRGTRLTRWHVR